LILLDPLGQGESDKPRSTQAYTPDHRIADILAVLDAVAVDRTHFWGYSLGAHLGLVFAARQPNRLLSVIVGGAAGRLTPPHTDFADLLEQGGMRAFVERAESALSPFPLSVHERMLTQDPEALAAAALVGLPSVQAYLGAIDLPALLYCGDKDAPHDAARHAADVMPGATFVSLAGLNHVDAYIESELVLPHASAFLSGVLASPGLKT
jgi:pimeloyl-ACP methyl ester carboxylesterase